MCFPNAMVAKSEILAAFNMYLTDAGKPPMTKTAFGLAHVHRSQMHIGIAADERPVSSLVSINRAGRCPRRPLQRAWQAANPRGFEPR